MSPPMPQADLFLRQLAPHRGLVTSYCRRLLMAPADLEDALQEVLAVALRRFVQGTCPAPGPGLRPWLLRIATLTCFGVNRKRRRHAASLFLEAAHIPDAPIDVLERECAYERLLAHPASVLEGCADELVRALQSLRENERAIFLLKSLGGLSCAEIARVLDVPLGTSQGLLSRARTKLREQLAEFARAHGFADTTGKSPRRNPR